VLHWYWHFGLGGLASVPQPPGLTADDSVLAVKPVLSPEQMFEFDGGRVPALTHL